MSKPLELPEELIRIKAHEIWQKRQSEGEYGTAESDWDESDWDESDWDKAVDYLKNHPWEVSQWELRKRKTLNNQYGRSAEEDLEIWKHFASFGGEDKNRMVTIATSLLGGSAVILWYIWTEQVNFDDGNLVLEEAGRALGVAILGAGVSFLAAYVSLLYGGYSNPHSAPTI